MAEICNFIPALPNPTFSPPSPPFSEFLQERFLAPIIHLLTIDPFHTAWYRFVKGFSTKIRSKVQGLENLIFMFRGAPLGLRV